MSLKAWSATLVIMIFALPLLISMNSSAVRMHIGFVHASFPPLLLEFGMSIHYSLKINATIPPFPNFHL